MLQKYTARILLCYEPINDGIIRVRLKGIPHKNITIIQFYAPTSVASEEERERAVL